MSADNWTTCPKCFDDAQRAHDIECERVTGMYGTAPAEEFIAARDALTPPQAADFVTLREDYEFYNARTGTVKWKYKARCTECGTGVEFDGERSFWTGEPI